MAIEQYPDPRAMDSNRLPRGVLLVDSDQTGTAAHALSAGTAETVMYTPVAITTEAGRRYRISGYFTRAGGSDAYITARCRRQLGGAAPTTASTLVGLMRQGRSASNNLESCAFEFYDEPGAGVCRWAITFQPDAGVYDLYGPRLIVYEDVGAV